ncbi:MAG: hypothetical protein HY519_04250 [Candidatus Aenigmarchaeota archaeon]|nr:hypothetical protein [Candidatus Aenigmarchaeota archaeon]
MNVPLFAWVVILFLGFMLTHLAALQAPDYILLIWLVLVIAGFLVTFRYAHREQGERNISVAWGAAVLAGFLLTAALLALNVNPAYLMALWFLLIGSAMLANGMVEQYAPAISAGLFWAVSAVLVALLPELQDAQFIYAAIAFGVPMVAMGLLLKDHI